MAKDTDAQTEIERLGGAITDHWKLEDEYECGRPRDVCTLPSGRSEITAEEAHELALFGKEGELAAQL